MLFSARPCVPACRPDQACVNGLCVNTGNLGISLTWSVRGDGDIVVTTPNNRHIYHGNRGTSSATDFGTLDRDDTTGTGPENVYWSPGNTPPNGTYHICFQQYALTATPTNPITAIIEIRIPGQITQTVVKTFITKPAFNNICSPTLPTYMATFTFPWNSFPHWLSMHKMYLSKECLSVVYLFSNMWHEIDGSR